jgi:hypothetical protein
LEAWLTEIGAAEALAPLRNEEFDTVAALRDLAGSAGEEGLADIEGASSRVPSHVLQLRINFIYSVQPVIVLRTPSCSQYPLNRALSYT